MSSTSRVAKPTTKDYERIIMQNTGERMIKPPLIIDAGESFKISDISEGQLKEHGAIIINGYTPKLSKSNNDLIYTEGIHRTTRKPRVGSQLPHIDNLDKIPVLVLYSPEECIIDEHEPYTFYGDKTQVRDAIKRFFISKANEQVRSSLRGRLSSVIPSLVRRPTLDNTLLEGIRKAIEEQGNDNIGPEKSLKQGFTPLSWDELFENIYTHRSEYLGIKESNSMEFNELIEYLIGEKILYLHQWQPNQTLLMYNSACMHGCYNPYGNANMTDFILRRKAFRFDENGRIVES